VTFFDSLEALFSEEAVVWGFLAAVVLTLVLTPATAWLAPRIGAVDDPGHSDRPRVHDRPLPRIGGLAIVVGILVPAAYFIPLDGPYGGILLGTALVSLLGLWDDIWGLRPKHKMIGVLLIACVPVVGWNLVFENSQVLFEGIDLPVVGNFDFGRFDVFITILWIAFLANLVNLIDGLDALAAGIVSIAAVSFAILAMSFGRADAAALAAMVCGATLAFLRHNYHPARIIMGDTGSLALGFVLACVAVQGVLKTAASVALIIPLLVLAVPILDTSFVVAKRLKYGRKPWAADHNHFYHRFMRIGYSQRRTAAYLHLWAALLSAWAILVRFVPPRPGGEWDLRNTLIVGALGLVVFATSVWMIYTLEILKARHLRVLGLGRFAPEEDVSEPSEPVAAGRR
jgi:UDP-GlcNAc:undecaprenyl-phosphate GlcNAc-1-phosphate transferase